MACPSGEPEPSTFLLLSFPCFFRPAASAFSRDYSLRAKWTKKRVQHLSCIPFISLRLLPCPIHTIYVYCCRPLPVPFLATTHSEPSGACEEFNTCPVFIPFIRLRFLPFSVHTIHLSFSGGCSFWGLGCCSCRVRVCVGVGGVVICRCVCVCDLLIFLRYIFSTAVGPPLAPFLATTHFAPSGPCESSTSCHTSSRQGCSHRPTGPPPTSSSSPLPSLRSWRVSLPSW